MHLVLVDSFSGWFELDHLPDMRSVTVIAKLKRHFAVHGTLQTLLTDNAQQFVCSDFSDFARAWDFEHIRSSPRYPQSNGLADAQCDPPNICLRSVTESAVTYKLLYSICVIFHALTDPGLPDRQKSGGQNGQQHLISPDPQHWCTAGLRPQPTPVLPVHTRLYSNTQLECHRQIC